jgi:hypothetical protein
MQGLGLSVVLIGLKMALSGEKLIATIGYLLLGGLTGELLRIEERIEKVGEWLKKRSGSDSSSFVQGFVSASLLYLVGAMMIVGSIQLFCSFRLRGPRLHNTTGLETVVSPESQCPERHHRYRRTAYFGDWYQSAGAQIYKNGQPLASASVCHSGSSDHGLKGGLNDRRFNKKN